LLGGAVGQHRPDDRNPEPRFIEEPMTAELNALEIERRLTRIDAMVATVATKADFENLKTWIVCTVLVAVVNLVGTVGVIVAFVLTG